MTRDQIFAAIIAERGRQIAKWYGNGPHDWGEGDCSSDLVPDPVKAAVLLEETGEVARAMLDHKPADLARELVQVAAVAVAWLEALPEPAGNR